MAAFARRDGALFAEEVSIDAIAATVGTPFYLYSKAALVDGVSAWQLAFARVPHLLAYSIKANSNLAVVSLLARAGCGVDVLSGGELYRALQAGVPPSRITMAGVGKRREEMEEALRAGVLMFNVESEPELRLLDRVARSRGERARIALRVNPDIDAGTHPYIATGLKTDKFGVPIERAEALFAGAAAMEGIEPVGVHVHIGSQITDVAPFVASLEKASALVEALRAAGVGIRYLNLGGGFAIRYREEQPLAPHDLAAALVDRVAALGVTLILEPGRALVGNAGILVTRVLYDKDTGHKRFVIVDAAMNDLIRPSLYQAWHDIEPVALRDDAAEHVVDVVGPVCESGDFFARDRALPEAKAGELLAIRSAGAYGMTMSSNYNARRRPAEVLVDGDRWAVIRVRERYEDLVALDRFAPELGAAPPKGDGA